MSHALSEAIAGLASRVNNLSAVESGPPSRELSRLQERLEKLTLAAIAEDLDDSAADYKSAVEALQGATKVVRDGDHAIEKISEAIELIAKAADLAEKAIKAAAG